MKHWQQYNEQQRLQLLDITAAQKGLPRIAIEKDWWVTMTLKALSRTPYAHLMSFKGGTSLSKGWNLINRFSEDIDIALRRAERFAISSTSNNQLSKVRRVARHYIVRELPEELAEALSFFGVTDFGVEPDTERMRDGEKVELSATTHPSTIFVNYKSVVPELSDYIMPQVKIEVSCLSMDEPVEQKLLNTFIGEAVPSADEVSVQFSTVIPTRTFLEKIFLLHEEFQKKNPRSYRMSRHLYDIEKLMRTAFGSEALHDRELYDTIVHHRSTFNNIKGLDYSLHAPQTICFLPPERVYRAWKDDYEAMCKDFIFEKSPLPFDDLLQQIEILQNRIRTL